MSSLLKKSILMYTSSNFVDSTSPLKHYKMGTTQGVIHRLKPVFSEKEIPDQPSQIFIVTGGGTGYGSVIGQALDHLNGRVSIVSRLARNAIGRVHAIRNSSPAVG